MVMRFRSLVFLALAVVAAPVHAVTYNYWKYNPTGQKVYLSIGDTCAAVKSYFRSVGNDATIAVYSSGLTCTANGYPIAAVGVYYKTCADGQLLESNASGGSATCVAPPNPENLGCPEKACPEGNPINVGAGNKLQRELDYEGGGLFPLRLERFYNSGGNFVGGGTYYSTSRDPLPRQLGGVGPYWNGYYLRRLVVGDAYVNLVTNQSGTDYYTILAIRPTGDAIFFKSTELPATNNPAIHEKLQRLQNPDGSTSGWMLTSASGSLKEFYDASGTLLALEDRNGNRHSLEYDISGRVWKVTDPLGKKLTFSYMSAVPASTSMQVASVQTPQGTISYTYDANGMLNKVTHEDGSNRQYKYEVAGSPNLLTGIVDEKGVRYATWSYANGLAVSSEHAGGVEKVSVTYGSNGAVTVTNALGKTKGQTIATVSRLKLPATVGTYAEPGASAPSTTRVYDANSNITSVTDPRGIVTTYTYDLARNLEVSRTEASGTPQARTITTTWHATWELPLTVTEPGRTTTYTYDAKGNRLSKTVTDTATSQSQSWTWTYNSAGQVLSEDGPRTDVSDVATYSYYASPSPYKGFLQSVTNAVGQATQLTSYNAQGQVLTMLDPNGVTTTFTYDARGRQKSRSSNGKTTSYDYDAVGQMTKVTLPDGNWVTYTYDDAHRLTAIQDKAGNKVVYTLDLMSRRTKEEVHDTQGTLAGALKWVETLLASTSAPSLAAH